jgi:small-conductance mechanosensitive channel
LKNLHKIYHQFLTIILLTLVLGACVKTTTPTPTPTLTITPTQDESEISGAEITDEKEGSTSEPEVESTEEQLLVTPTLAPTATPGVVDEFISNIAEQTGADRTYLLGLSLEDWANLVISVLIILLGIFIVNKFLQYILHKAASRSGNPWVEAFVEVIRPQIGWFVIVLFAQFATTRLLFLSPEVKQWLGQFYYVCYVAIITVIVWKLVDVIEKWYEQGVSAQKESQLPSEAILPLTKRVIRGVVVLVAIIVILDRFGVNVTALTAAIGIGGLALSLAAQDTLADMISGLIILVDQPFRVGDRIEIQSINTWGDVADIGTRTTRIRTRDNRMVIVPNSVIGKSEVINYTYPDTRYRVQIEIGVSYDSDIERVRKIIVDTVSQVEGVLLEKPVDALFLEFGNTAMIIRVRWWINSYIDTRRMFDKVNTDLLKALSEAGVDMPFTTYDVNIRHVEGVREVKESK